MGHLDFPGVGMKSIAVVEDDACVLDALQLVLESHGWRAFMYETADAFLTRRDGVSFDCVVLDPHLAGRSGLEVARVVARSHVPFIVLTARPESPLTHAIAELGARAVITKPVDAEALTDLIDSVTRDTG